MKSTNVLATLISGLLVPYYVVAGPIALPPSCVCVTNPCPCDGSDRAPFVIKERAAPPPPPSDCIIGDELCETPLTRDWCLENRDECRMRLGFASEKRGEDAAVQVKRSPSPARPAPDPLELCLKYWHLCTGGSR